MILYLDTSALVKLLRIEQGSELVGKAAEAAAALAASTLARIEVHSALARLLREGQPSESVRASLVAFETLWKAVAQVQMDRAVDAACGLCHKHPIRTLDAIHLASALSLGDDLDSFVVYDVRLAEAARIAGLRVERPS